MRNKLIALTGAIFLGVALLAGCGKSEEKTNTPTAAPTDTTPEANPTDAPENKADYAVSISINPGIEFNVVIDENGRDTIQEVVFLNDDAKKVYESMGIDLVGMTVPDASRYFVAAAIQSGYLKEYHNVTVSLAEAWSLPADILEEMISLKDVTQEVLVDENRDDAYVEADISAGAEIQVEKDPSSDKEPLYDVEGNCAVCHGVLLVVCDLCGGKAHGNGRVECDLCNHTGYLDCDNCNGSGAMTCGSCNGTGQVDGNTCNNCNGTKLEVCNRCAGEKKVTCNRCEGIGMMICNRCNGSLFMTCYRCEGTNNPEIEHK